MANINTMLFNDKKVLKLFIGDKLIYDSTNSLIPNSFVITNSEGKATATTQGTGIEIERPPIVQQ